MSTTTTTGLPYEPRPMSAPDRSFLERINVRVIIFVAIVVAIVGIPFGMWANEVVTGGIHNHGAFKEVDLKAMSTFDMDQINATMDDIPGKWRNLEGQKVLMVGEMWAPKAAGDGKLGYFQLVYSKTKCCFSGPPLAQHFVDGNVVKGKTCYYYEEPVKVYGTVHISVYKEEGKIKSIYHVDVEKVEPIEG